MHPVKQFAIKAIEALPDDCSIADIVYQLHLLEQVLEGLSRLKTGEKTSPDDLRQRLEHLGPG